MKIFNRKAVASVIGAMVCLTAVAETPLWLRNVKISPDGKTISFTYKGDIFTVPAVGGPARRITSQTAYETSPVWSPDSRKIAFASDAHGNYDVFVVDALGGQPTRLTNNSASEIPQAFSPDGSEVWFSAAIQAPASSILYPTGRMKQLYSIKVDGSEGARQIIGTPVTALNFSPDGRSFLYQDTKGFEDTWRKHHTSSVTRDIWCYDASTGRHENLTNRPGEDLDPVVTPDGENFLFISERDGNSLNVYTAPIAHPEQAKAITHLERHPVRFLSQASDGTIAFGYDGEIYTMTPGSTEPVKVLVDIVMDEPEPTEWLRVKAADGVPSPDGKQVAFINRGDVFVTSVEHESTKQITHTPAAEMQVDWRPDNRGLVYTSRRGGPFNIYTAEIARDDDPNFSNATLVNEAPAVGDDGVERTYPHYSPDGKHLAFVQDRNKLMVMDLNTRAVRQLTDGSTYAYRDGGFDYQWSPDSKWITLEILGNHHDPYSDIALIEVSTGEMTNLTQSGYTDRNPRFAMDGNAIVYLTERYGMRNHASWGSLDDAVIVFLNRDAYDRFRLSEEDYALRKDLDKKNKDDEDSSDIVVELDGINRRTMRLTPYSSDMADAWVDNDGETLYYLSSIEQGYDLWEMDIREQEPDIAARLDSDEATFYPSKDGSTLWISGDKVRKYNTSSGKVKSVSASGRMLLDRAAEREAMFDQVYISEREMFYDKNMHGVDWDGLTADYRRFLPHIATNDDFAEMLSELLGELNVSHTGASYRGNEANAAVDRTASLGLLYDMTHVGDGAKVDEVVDDGPFDRHGSKMVSGSVIKAINGREVTPQTDIFVLLNNLADTKTLVEFTTPSGEDVEEVVLPISSGEFNALMYERWVRGRAADVDRWSNGRLGYVHIDSMDDDSFRKVYSDILGKYNNREGVVIDIRWNGGGRLHEDIEVLFSGEKYFTQVIRDVESCDMPSRRYNKPSIMVMSEACYSNAHGTPWVYSHRGLGKLVGMPVAGTMTSVNWVKLQDNSLTFGIPVVGYRLADGSYLENSQLEPDIKVENRPEDVVRGEDAQLRAAVEELLREIDN